MPVLMVKLKPQNSCDRNSMELLSKEGLEKEREEGLQNICKFQNALYLKKITTVIPVFWYAMLKILSKKKNFSSLHQSFPIYFLFLTFWALGWGGVLGESISRQMPHLTFCCYCCCC